VLAARAGRACSSQVPSSIFDSTPSSTRGPTSTWAKLVVTAAEESKGEIRRAVDAALGREEAVGVLAVDR